MIHCIFLAAGSARRFGSNKLLAGFRGKPLYRHGLDVLQSAAEEHGDCTLTVVSRYDEILDDARSRNMEAVFGAESAGGLSFSLCHGIHSLTERGLLHDGDSLLFLVADQPYLTRETLLRLMDAGNAGALCACVTDGDPWGNPALFSVSLSGELLALTGDRGGGAVLRAHGTECVRIPCAFPGELADIDTREALSE